MMIEGIVRGRDGRVVIQYTQGGKGWLIVSSVNVLSGRSKQ